MGGKAQFFRKVVGGKLSLPPFYRAKERFFLNWQKQNYLLKEL